MSPVNEAVKDVMPDATDAGAVVPIVPIQDNASEDDVVALIGFRCTTRQSTTDSLQATRPVELESVFNPPSLSLASTEPDLSDGPPYLIDGPPASTDITVRKMRDQTLRSMQRLTGVQTPSRTSKSKKSSTVTKVAKPPKSPTKSAVTRTAATSPLTPTGSTAEACPISNVVIPSASASQAHTNAILSRNDGALNWQQEAYGARLAEINDHICFLEEQAASRHTEGLELIRESRVQAEARVAAAEARAANAEVRVVQVEMAREVLEGRLTRLINSHNGTRAGLNELVGGLEDAARDIAANTRDIELARECMRLEACMDIVTTDLIQLKSASRTPAVVLTTTARTPNTRSATTSPLQVVDAAPPRATPLETATSRNCAGRGANNTNKRPQPGNATTGDALNRTKRARTEHSPVRYNPALEQISSSSSTPFPTGSSAVTIGPHESSGSSASVFDGVIDLLPGALRFKTDLFATASEGKYVRAEFRGLHTAKDLVKLWNTTNPLEGTAHTLEIRLSGVREGALAALFGTKNC